MSEEGKNQAIAKKYSSFLSSRKYNFSCKIQPSIFDPVNQKWSGKVISYGDKKTNLREKCISNENVEKFVQAMDIGDIHGIPGYCGAARTVTALTTMIMDLHRSVSSLKNKLRWLNDIENHYIFEFSDDGAPESRDGNMCIGSLSLWNLGNRIRNREYQYPLHTVSCGEKEKVMEDLWKQHTDEMLLMEGNILNLNGEQVTVEFQC